MNKKLKEDILRQIGSISRALDSIANIEFKDIELNRGQYLYLVRIKENPGIIAEHLAQILCVDRTTTARSIQKLKKQNLISKVKDSTNKKIKHLYVTNQGKELVQIIERENSFSNAMVLKGLGVKEQQQLAKLLQVLEDNARQNWQFVKNGGKREY